MQTKKFQRTKEDFTCARCGFEVHGTGYTNHCPQCLWSRHVDVNPGDRAARCGGMMEPVSLEVAGGAQMITHQCTRCGFVRRNQAAPDDTREALIRVSAT